MSVGSRKSRVPKRRGSFKRFTRITQSTNWIRGEALVVAAVRAVVIAPVTMPDAAANRRSRDVTDRAAHNGANGATDQRARTSANRAIAKAFLRGRDTAQRQNRHDGQYQ
jgi:hypothetical protein